MSNILEAAILVGEESTYGTAASLTRGYEAKADTFTRVQEALESVGMRAGMHTQRSDRRRQINMGAEGELSDLDFMTNGMGLLMQSVLGASAGPTSDVITLTTTSTLLPTSYTIQVLRPVNDGTLSPFTYVGSVITSWTLSQVVGEFLKVGLTFDAQDEKDDVGAGTPAYADGEPFDWTQAAVTIGGSAVDDIREITFSGDLGLKTDRRYLRGSALKKQPCRVGAPTYSGQVLGDFADKDQYDRFVAGSIFPIVATWTGESFGGDNYEVVVTAPACQYDGASPQASMDDLTTETLPFRILHNGTDPAITITITSDDSAL